MDRLTQARPNIHGDYSGNQCNNSIIGSNNTIHINGRSGVAGYGDAMLGVGERAPKPHRLIPYARNRNFTGRKNVIETVKRFCEREGHNGVALYGLGGSGKTQIALEYIYQRGRDSGADVFWVHGSGELKFSEGFRAVAQLVRIPTSSLATDEESILLGVRSWLEGPNSGDWILVIDNADDEADFAAGGGPIAKFIPQGAKGTLVFTTRSRQVAYRQGCEMVEVGKMSEEEAEELFFKRYSGCGSLRDHEEKPVAMILGSVDHLPLAVVGAAAFMTEAGILPSSYWTILQENEDRMRKLLSQRFSDIQREADAPESILSTFFVTFNRITQQMPPAADLLRLMAFFDRQNIPEELLRRCGLEGMDDSIDFHRAIGQLLGFSLVAVVKCEDKTFYELHRLVQMSLQVYLSTEDLNKWRATALRVISRLFPQGRTERRPAGPAYVPHALAVTRDSTDPISEELCFRLGWYFLDMGSYNNAEIQVCRCIALREECKEHDWDSEGDERFMLLALVNSHQGKYSESEEINRRMLEEREMVLGPDHPNTLRSLNNLAQVLGKQGKYDESEAMHRRALEGYTRVLRPDHPRILTSLNNLAQVLHSQGKRSESEVINRRTLEVCEKVLGPDHPDTLTSLNNLASVLANQGKYVESESKIRRALEGREKVLGQDHPSTLRSLNNLAQVLGNLGKYDESEAINRRALEGRERALGPDHPDTLISLNNLAQVLGQQGKYDELGDMNRRAGNELSGE